MSTSCDATVKDIIKEFLVDRTRLMDIVLAIQHRLGHVSDDAVRVVAAGLGIHPVEWPIRSRPLSSTEWS
jgi:[NiFe] hydrogenase diaphorase moiety large subunit